MDSLLVRHVEPNDFPQIVDYFRNSDDEFLLAMGVDKRKLPEREKWLAILHKNYAAPIPQTQFYYLIWLLNDRAVGHSNINKIAYGQEAFMHMHAWQKDNRRRGLGSEFIKLCIPQYFWNFRLQTLYCEPYAHNPAPNRILEKTGFTLVRTYETVPGWINFHQPVNRWRMDVDTFRELYRPTD
ncbi:MAG TPA: GNAT family N-acetyltransferase [Chryseosolibacter sp.]|nr:GNAT family N-acetyltransferase [Chryseosolibacter sp.]